MNFIRTSSSFIAKYCCFFQKENDESCHLYYIKKLWLKGARSEITRNLEYFNVSWQGDKIFSAILVRRRYQSYDDMKESSLYVIDSNEFKIKQHES